MAVAAAVIDEQILVLGPARSLVGILTRPTAGPRTSDLALILLNAGLIHRVGPARLYVRLARALASQGVTVLRFDLSNLGDSAAREDNLPLLEAIVREPQDVMDDLGRIGYSRFVVAGICSGAYAAFKTACRDARVVGAGLINPQDFIGDPDWISYAWAQRYWKKSLFSMRAWRNLLTGRIDYRRLLTVLTQQLTNSLRGGNRQVATVTESLRGDLEMLQQRQVRLLLLFSAGDVSVEQFSLIFARDMNADESAGLVTQVILAGTDHLFGRSTDQARVLDAIGAWITSVEPGPSKLLTAPRVDSTLSV